MKPTAQLTTAFTATLLLLAACETMEGLGRDTQKLGNSVTDAAEKNDGNAHDDAGGTK